MNSNGILDPSLKMKVETKALSTIISDLIKTQIIEGKLPLGSIITETEVAEKLQVSRAVVREAFFALEKGDLLVKERNKCTKVVSFSKKDVEEIFDFRIAIEIASALMCIKDQNIPLEKLLEEAKLADHPQEIEPYTHKASEDIKRGINFHRRLVIYSGNERMLQAYDGLYNQIMTLIYHYGYREHSPISHADIVYAMLDKDTIRVEKILQEHIRNTEEYLVKKCI